MGEEMRRVSMKELLKKRIAGEQRGAFIVFTALAIWFLMMFVAFAIDFGNYYQHRTRLQNAADAAALAGVAQYADSELIGYTMSEKGKGRLVKLPTSITGGEAGKSATFSADDYTFTKLDKVPTEVHAQGQNYVQKNYRSDLDIKEDSMWSATQESTSSTTTQAAGGTTQITTTTSSSRQFCYRVDLEDKVTTFFARIFGVNELTVNVSAMAMLDGATNSTVEELLPMVSGHINDIIPNYYWESIANYVSNIYDTNGNLVGTTGASDPKHHDDFSSKAYGRTNLYYLLSDSKFDYKEVEWGARDGVIGFKDKDKDGNDITDGICAEPIYATAGDDCKNTVLTQVFRFESPNSVLYNGKEIIGLFLDRDNVTKNNYGKCDRFADIYIGKIASTDTDAIKINPNVPIYARLESEPVQISNRAPVTVNGETFKTGGLTSVCGVTFHMTWKPDYYDYNNDDEKKKFDEELGKIKPFVFAYDGPDPNRDDDDGPWVATEAIKKAEAPKINRDYKPGEILQDKEPLLKIVGGDRSAIPSTLVQSSTSTPGPITVLIPHGRVFKGVIWAPRSKVTIIGGGKIIGFIAARRIDDSQYTGPHKFEKAQQISLPSLAAFRPASTTKHDYFDYVKSYITDEYHMVYTQFVDYTDKSLLP